jgi:hypothetical protein
LDVTRPDDDHAEQAVTLVPREHQVADAVPVAQLGLPPFKFGMPEEVNRSIGGYLVRPQRHRHCL